MRLQAGTSPHDATRRGVADASGRVGGAARVLSAVFHAVVGKRTRRSECRLPQARHLTATQPSTRKGQSG